MQKWLFFVIKLIANIAIILCFLTFAVVQFSLMFFMQLTQKNKANFSPNKTTLREDDSPVLDI